MLVGELKKVLKIHFEIAKKTYNPITRFINFKNDEINSTDMEMYATTDFKFPLDVCVLAADLKLFLNTLKDDVELQFIKDNNYLEIKYGKKNSIKISTSVEDEFPVFDDKQENFQFSIDLDDNFNNNLAIAIEYCLKNSGDNFNNIFINAKNMYSTNREIIYRGNVDLEFNDYIKIPHKMAEFLVKNKSVKIDVCESKYVITDSINRIYYLRSNECKVPAFEAIYSDFNTAFLETDNSLIAVDDVEVIIEALERFRKFGTKVKIQFVDNVLKIYNDKIEEEIITSKKVNTEVLLCNISYLLETLKSCANLYFVVNKLGGTNNKASIIFSLMLY